MRTGGEIYARLWPLSLELGLNLAHSAVLTIGKEDLTLKCKRIKTIGTQEVVFESATVSPGLHLH